MWPCNRQGRATARPRVLTQRARLRQGSGRLTCPSEFAGPSCCRCRPAVPPICAPQTCRFSEPHQQGHRQSRQVMCTLEPIAVATMPLYRRPQLLVVPRIASSGRRSVPEQDEGSPAGAPILSWTGGMRGGSGASERQRRSARRGCACNKQTQHNRCVTTVDVLPWCSKQVSWHRASQGPARGGQGRCTKPFTAVLLPHDPRFMRPGLYCVAHLADAQVGRRTWLGPGARLLGFYRVPHAQKPVA